MTTTLTIANLITACGSATSETKAREVIETARAFALNSTDNDMPNRMPVARECTIYLSDLSSTNYSARITNLKKSLEAVQNLSDGSITPD